MADWKSRMQKGATKVASEAGKMARLTKAQSELAALRRQLTGLQADLGRAVYDLRERKQGDPAAIGELCQKITAHLELIAQKNQLIHDLSAEAGAANDANSPGKKCPNCQHDMPEQARFCSECGYKW